MGRWTWTVAALLALAACAGGSAPDATDPAPSAATGSIDGGGGDDTVPTDDDAAGDDAELDAPPNTTDDPDATTTSDVADAWQPPTIEVAPNPNNTLSAIVTIELPDPAAVEVSAISGDHWVTLPRTAATRRTHTIPLVGLRSERDYEIVAELVDADGAVFDSVAASFTSGSVPDRFAAFEFTSDPERSSPGYTIIEMQRWRDLSAVTPQRPFDDPQYLIALDDDGEIVWYYENGPVVGGVEQTADGNFTSIWFPNGVREFDMLGNEVGDWAIPLRDTATDDAETAGDDASGLRRLQAANGIDALDPLPLQSPDVDLHLTHHEAYRLANGHYLALSTAHHPLTPEQRATFCPGDPAPFGVFSDVAVEFTADGEVLRTWDLWDVVDVDAVPGEEMCNVFFEVDGDRDWTHANAVVYDEQRDAVIFSARHTSQVIAMRHLDREGPQTELLWSFGTGGTMPIVGDVPRYQHAVEVQDDGSILLYDNGNGRAGTIPGDPAAPTYSRAVLYGVEDSSPDPADWTVTQRWEHRLVEDDGSAVFAPIIGDADRLANGNVLITHGSIGFMNPDDHLHSTIIEVAPDGDAGGDIVWRFDAGTPDVMMTNYRAERIESFYVGPDWEPT